MHIQPPEGGAHVELEGQRFSLFSTDPDTVTKSFSHERFKNSGVPFWKTWYQSRGICVMCAVKIQTAEKTDSKSDHAAEVLKEKHMPRGAKSNLHMRAGEPPNRLLE